MPRINLLPWRDELRTQRRNQFYLALGAAAGGAAFALLVSNLIFSGIVSHQGDRNVRLKEEISLLDLRIEEILDLEDKKDRLLARMAIIEQLQRSRPGIVHVFEELVSTLPDGVYLTAVKQSGQDVEIVGSAESNTRVSALMRKLDESDWFTKPDLEVVEVKARKGDGRDRRASEFVVHAKQASTDPEDEETS
jgi:type IV pilus assembly protein PilN